MSEGFTYEDLELAIKKKIEERRQIQCVLIIIETALAGFFLNQQSIENIKTEIETILQHNYDTRGGNVSFVVSSELLFSDSSETMIVSCISKHVPDTLVNLGIIATNFANSLLRDNGSSYSIKITPIRGNENKYVLKIQIIAG